LGICAELMIAGSALASDVLRGFILFWAQLRYRSQSYGRGCGSLWPTPDMGAWASSMYS
jgi:hypothetical protein